jgi:Na+-translocating ferredoxin:NAD+ oxidoreductase subunit G
MKENKTQYLADAWLVLLLALCFGGGLAGVQAGLQDRIETNKLAETARQIPALVPGAAKGDPVEIGGKTVYRAVDAAGAPVGWVIPAGGQGFADRIEILLGMDARGEALTGIYILEQKETPGLGNKIVDGDWRAQFVGKPLSAPLTVTKGRADKPSEVEAITGATISSDSVVDIVNRTADEFSKAVREHRENEGS